ncbi:MAG: ThuA domain-containing protein [Verrucomicrobia bacterium]|nr:ThuA domain-containing protein [Verrucomicrobiota bacterium]
MKTNKVLLAVALLAAAGTAVNGAEKLKTLIVDGQNNHDWKSCTPVLKWILEDSGRFTVDISTAPPAVQAPKTPKGDLTPEQKTAREAALAKWQAEKEKTVQSWKQWRPAFQSYNVVVCNYTGEAWPAEVRADFEQYVKNGGGLVIVHAADNAFPEWPEYNEMIGVGGWGGRNEKSGPMLYWTEAGLVRDTSPGAGGTHGAQHEFVVETRDPAHPIMQGLPARWKHASDELYSKMRGPARNLTVLATAYAAPEKGGTGKNEPILMTISYGKGRIFHTVLGHGPSAMAGLGFQVTLQRGAEWAATGNVTLLAPKPEDLPADKAALRAPPKAGK